MFYSSNKSNNNKRKRHIAVKIIAAVVAIVIICIISAGCYIFYRDPYWQLLYSLNKLVKSDSFSFELGIEQEINMDIPILPENTFETQCVFKGDVQCDFDNSEFTMRAESEDDIIFLQIKDDECRLKRKENIEGSQWADENIVMSQEFDSQQSITASNIHSDNMLAKYSSKNLGFISSAFKGYNKIKEYSNLDITRENGEEEINGTVMISEVLNSKSVENSIFLFVIMLFLGWENDKLDIDSIACSDSELLWKNNSNNYPYEISLDCVLNVSAADLIADQIENSPELQNIMGLIGGYLNIDVQCQSHMELKTYNYNEVTVYTDDIEK